MEKNPLFDSQKKTHPIESSLECIADKIKMIAQNDGDFTTSVTALSVHRRSAPTAPVHCIYRIGLGVVIQGSKEVVLGEKIVAYRAGQMLLTTLELPVVAHVATASVSSPFLGITVTIDPSTVQQIAATLPFRTSAKEKNFDPLAINVLDIGIVDTLRRLITLNNDPDLIPHLAPLIQKEMIIRLLTGPYGNALRHMTAPGSPGQQVSRVVAWIKQHFIERISIDELAAIAAMSASSFRLHFRTVTGMSPLQFIKKLRLQEARQQMLNSHLDAVSAAIEVGYESASQFNREYSREFGESPQRDIKRIRGEIS